MSQKRPQNGTWTSEKMFSLINGQEKYDNKTARHLYPPAWQNVSIKHHQVLVVTWSHRNSKSRSVTWLHSPKGASGGLERREADTHYVRVLGITLCFPPVTVWVSPIINPPKRTSDEDGGAGSFTWELENRARRETGNQGKPVGVCYQAG